MKLASQQESDQPHAAARHGRANGPQLLLQPPQRRGPLKQSASGRETRPEALRNAADDLGSGSDISYNVVLVLVLVVVGGGVRSGPGGEGISVLSVPTPSGLFDGHMIYTQSSQTNEQSTDALTPHPEAVSCKARGPPPLPLGYTASSTAGARPSRGEHENSISWPKPSICRWTTAPEFRLVTGSLYRI